MAEEGKLAGWGENSNEKANLEEKGG